MPDSNAPFGKRPATLAPQLLQELSAKSAELSAAPAANAGPLWGAMHKALLKAKVDPQVIMRFVASRDSTSVDLLVRWLSGEEIELPAAPLEVAPIVVDPETMKSAMKMFLKRLKYARLDAESKLGVGPMSSGKKSEIDAMEPPRDFPSSVWNALVAAGRLKKEGAGFYSLVVDDVSDD